MPGLASRHFEELVAIAREGVWWVDREFRTTFVNPALERMLGYRADEMVGRPAADLLAPEARDRVVSLQERRKQGTFENVEVALLRKDGSRCWVTSITHPVFDEDGAFDGAFGLVTDITEKKEAEVQLRETQKLETLGVLAGGIAHDFNNLIAGILGNIELTRREIAGADGSAHLRLAEEAALRAAGLTKQLLAFAAKRRLPERTLDLTELARATIDLLGKGRGRVRVHGERVLVRGDEVQLGQVVLNLCLNAIEASEPDGTVEVQVREQDVDRAMLGHCMLGAEREPGRWVVLSVRDEGAGMDAETAKRIFEPFFTTKVTGRGLGLAATLGILRSHHGALCLVTAPGAGTTFTVLLPPAPTP